MSELPLPLKADEPEPNVVDSKLKRLQKQLEDNPNSGPNDTANKPKTSKRVQWNNASYEKINMATVSFAEELSTFYGIDAINVEDYDAILSMSGDDFLGRDLPKGYLKGVSDPEEGETWRKAFHDDELQKLKKYKTLDFDNPVTLQEAKTKEYEVLNADVIWKRKTTANLQTMKTVLSKHKARFCAKELTGERGKETHVHVAREQSIRMAIAFGFQNNKVQATGDYESAFLHGKHKYRTLIRMPPGLREYDEDGNELACWLVGNLHGTTTGGNVFANLNRETLIALGFKPFASDHAVYGGKFDEWGHIIVYTHVDDCGLVADTMLAIEFVINGLKKVFTMTGPFPLESFTGCNIIINEHVLIFHGIPWLLERLKEYGLTDDKGEIKQAMTLKQPFKGEAVDEKSPLLEGDEKKLAQNMKGCAVWASHKFRPDIKVAVLKACRHMSKPTVQTIGWIFDVWRYIAGTLNWVVGTRKNKKYLVNPLEVHVSLCTGTNDSLMQDQWKAADPCIHYDASWVLPHSITGLISLAFGLVVDTKSTVQSTVASSSTDSEITAQLLATKEGVWKRRYLLELLGITEEDLQLAKMALTVPIYGDNLNALKYGRELVITSKLKHLAVATHLCHEKSQSKEVSFHQVGTTENWADFFTKHHGPAGVDKNRAKWMILYRPNDPG